MPSGPPDPYAAASPCLNFVAWDRKPTRARLPGLHIVVTGHPVRGPWRCCIEGILSN